ncbi:MAG: hypothetical protein QM764_15785 [Chitinophagaceae bacterium]
MRQKILSILNIRQSESRYVFDLVPLQFCIGIANAFTNIIAITFFIHEFSVTLLPYAYLAVAVSLILANILYTRLEHKYPPLILLERIIIFCSVILVLLWVGLHFFDEHLFTFLLLVWSIIFYMISGYAFWGLVSLLFNVRESKRVFSIVGSGDIPAKLLGYITYPFLTPFIGLNNLIWLAFGSLIIGLILLYRVIHKKKWNRIIHHQSHPHEAHVTETKVRKGPFSFFFENPLILSISVLSLVSYNVFNLIDFTFLSQVKLKFEDISSLAAFVAIFFAAGRLVALIMKLALTSRVIERLGIISCLFITPITLCVFCILFLLGVSNSLSYVYIFGVMALLTEVLRSTIQEPIFFILFQPLKEPLRLKGHIISKGYMLAPSLVIVGLSLIFFYKTGITLTIPLTFKILILNLVLWGILIYFLRRAYLKTLHNSISKGIFSSRDIHIHDKKTADLLIDKIRTGKENEVVFALNTLENAKHPSFEELLKEQLYNQHPSVRKYTLDRMEATNKLHTDTLQELLQSEKNSEVKQKIIHLLCHHDKHFLSAAAEKLDSYDNATRKTIIVNMLDQHEFDQLLSVGNEINTLIHSSITEDRLLAIEIISELKNVHFTKNLKALIGDSQLQIKRNAIIAAGKLKIQGLIPDIVQFLDHPTEKYISMQGCIHYGDDFFDDVKRQSSDAGERYEEPFIKIAAKVKGRHSTNFLLSKLRSPTAERHKLIQALWEKEFKTNNQEETTQLNKLLEDHLAASVRKLEYYHSFPHYENLDLIRDSLESEIRNDLDTALKTCTFIFDNKEINRTLELIATSQKHRLFNAMEMLELVLPKKITKELNYLFDFAMEPFHRKKAIHPPEVPLLVNNIIHKKDLLFQPWTRSVCMYSSLKNNFSDVLVVIKESVNEEKSYLVKETRDFILNEIS